MAKGKSGVMGQRVLVVDDDDAVMTSIAHIVKHQGHEPVMASDWIGALEAIEQEPPDVILLDLSMPHVDGIALLKFIRNRDLSIPVVVVSAFIDEDSRTDLTKLGVAAFVAKPFTMSDLNAEIQRAIDKPLNGSENEVLASKNPVVYPLQEQNQAVEVEDRERRRERIRRRNRELRNPRMKPKVLIAVAVSCVALAVLLGILNFYLSH